MTAIEWTDETWNPVTGCSKVSPGCDHCYAETLSLRYGWSKKPWTPENAAENVKLKPNKIEDPLKWRKPRRVFVNSMSDLFHEEIPDVYIRTVFSIMASTEHTFQVLTKRPRRMRDFLNAHHWRCGLMFWSGPTRNHLLHHFLVPNDADVSVEGLPGSGGLVVDPPKNIWLGVSIESWRFNWRADVLRETPTAVRFISAEPLLDTLYPSDRPERWLNLEGIDWLIAGGESGPRHRPMDAEWVRELRRECQSFGVAFFFKQWGGRTPKAGGRELDGRTWDDYPEAA